MRYIWSLMLAVTLFLSGCAHVKTQLDFYRPIMSDLKMQNYDLAVQKIDKAREHNKYTQKDRVLFYLDKGAALYYQHNHENSIEQFEEADRAMEELFTKSISKAALSMLLNDNALDYFGDIHENIYVNVFKSLGYLQMNKFDDAYVEVRRVNDKLRELDDKYGKMVDELNKSDETEVKIEKVQNKFYDDVLAHYLSYLIFRAEGEWDNSRISFEKLIKGWNAQPDIYDFSFPRVLKNKSAKKGSVLNVIAFTGNGPYKYAVGGTITTYKNTVMITDLSGFRNNVMIPFPGAEPGHHFKFAFPRIKVKPSAISRIEVRVDGSYAGELELIEDMGKVAVHTFESKMHMIYFKTIIRTVVKGIAATASKKKLREESEAGAFLGALIDAATDAAFDATENPDLRCWRTMPQKCYITELRLQPGVHQIEIRFLDSAGKLVTQKSYNDYEVGKGLNLIQTFSLN